MCVPAEIRREAEQQARAARANSFFRKESIVAKSAFLIVVFWSVHILCKAVNCVIKAPG
jgi:hypothetical protein